MKGIILAGGSGTRLYPATKVISKQILPINDKPMVYYPLSVLMMAHIKEILIISSERDLPLFKELLGDGKELGLSLSYAIQKEPNGIAEAFKIGEDFIANSPVALILGDNIFYGSDFSKFLIDKKNKNSGATVFGYEVSDPERFGVIEFNKNKEVLSIQEKPKFPRSNFAVVGFYIYDSKVAEYAKLLKPSKRGELEITDLNKIYQKKGKLKAEILEKGFAWLDTGTANSLLEASQFVNIIEKRQGIKVGCIEEVAYRNGWINKKKLKTIADSLPSPGYGEYLLKLAKKKTI